MCLQLLRIEQDGAFVGMLDRYKRSSAASGHRLGSEQRREATQYVANVTRLKRRIDWRLQQLVTRPLSQIDPVSLQVLRLGQYILLSSLLTCTIAAVLCTVMNGFSPTAGIYELFEVRMPLHAINAHVEVAKSMVGRGSTGFVNGEPFSYADILGMSA